MEIITQTRGRRAGVQPREYVPRPVEILSLANTKIISVSPLAQQSGIALARTVSVGLDKPAIVIMQASDRF